jgi:hypothetical protein
VAPEHPPGGTARPSPEGAESRKIIALLFAGV